MKNKVLYRISLIISIIMILITLFLLFRPHRAYNPNPLDVGSYMYEPSSGFEKVSGAASILSLFFTFFFRYKDNKERQKDDGEHKEQFMSLVKDMQDAELNDFDRVIDKKGAALSIDEKTYDNGYETTLTIRNNGEAEARNVMVEVLPDKEQNETNARIVNAEILPKEIVFPKGSFQVTVECWYPKAYRDVVVTWEDTKPRKVVQNVQLSKNYVV